MSLNTTIAALILAAGRSSRMSGGHHKLLLPLAGRPVLAHVVEAARAAQTRPVVVVLGHQASELQAALHTHIDDPNLVLITNPTYAEGMSTSLHVGLHALMQHHQSCQGAVVLLGDQPLVTADLINRLIAARLETGQAIVAPLYNGKRGNPVLFDARLFPELLTVTGDEGGRSVIERHRSEIASVEMGSVQAWYDVDTWEAYQQVLAAWQSPGV